MMSCVDVTSIADVRGKKTFLVEFERDQCRVTKRVCVSDAEFACAKNDNAIRAALLVSMQRACKQADRDIAFSLHGDSWRNHCEFPPGGFWKPLDADRMQPLFGRFIEKMNA